jgi:hypothetical protein
MLNALKCFVLNGSDGFISGEARPQRSGRDPQPQRCGVQGRGLCIVPNTSKKEVRQGPGVDSGVSAAQRSAADAGARRGRQEAEPRFTVPFGNRLPPSKFYALQIRRQ